MKYITGIILGIILASGVVVYAKGGMEHVNTLGLEFPFSAQPFLHKVYDNDNGVVCYVVFANYGQGSSAGISCVK